MKEGLIMEFPINPFDCQSKGNLSTMTVDNKFKFKLNLEFWSTSDEYPWWIVMRHVMWRHVHLSYTNWLPILLKWVDPFQLVWPMSWNRLSSVILVWPAVLDDFDFFDFDQPEIFISSWEINQWFNHLKILMPMIGSIFTCINWFKFLSYAYS